jgi:NADH-quinone oxidoreductase subunit L
MASDALLGAFALALATGSAAGLLAAALPAWLGRPLGEAALLRAVRAGQLLCAAATLGLVAQLARAAAAAPPGASAFVEWTLPWLVGGGREPLELGLRADAGALCASAAVSALCALGQQFSARYLHREPGFARFFLLLSILQLGLQLLILAPGLPSFIAGWELVGIASALLIGFFHERREPVQNGLTAFATYRICDIGLLLGTALLGHSSGSLRFADLAALRAGAEGAPLSLQAAALLFVLAAAGKSAQLPASAWLPRAMEGPTPSSALFYGALSIHAGLYLLIRIEPLLRLSPAAQGLLVVMGATSALYGALVASVEADVKSQLAHGALAQAGLICAELGLGFTQLALWHLAAHACWRSWQFLRAPSAIHDAHELHGLLSHAPPRRAVWFARLSAARQAALYAAALDRFGLERGVERWLLEPVRATARVLAWLDPWAPPAPGEGGEAAGIRLRGAAALGGVRSAAASADALPTAPLERRAAPRELRS